MILTWGGATLLYRRYVIYIGIVASKYRGIMKYLFVIMLFTLSAGTVHGQRYSTIVLRSLDKEDSLAKFLDVADIRTPLPEKEKHKLIWKIEAVRKAAISLKEKGVETFTMTDGTPTKDSPYYTIGFYELIITHSNRLMTYRISKDLTIELYNFDDDTWTKVK